MTLKCILWYFKEKVLYTQHLFYQGKNNDLIIVRPGSQILVNSCHKNKKNAIKSTHHDHLGDPNSHVTCHSQPPPPNIIFLIFHNVDTCVDVVNVTVIKAFKKNYFWWQLCYWCWWEKTAFSKLPVWPKEAKCWNKNNYYIPGAATKQRHLKW